MRDNLKEIIGIVVIAALFAGFLWGISTVMTIKEEKQEMKEQSSSSEIPNKSENPTCSDCVSRELEELPLTVTPIR
jgi:hypothetical protein